MINFDEKSKYIYTCLTTGKITRQEFCEAYDSLFSLVDSKDKKNLENRLDKTKNQQGRTLGKFALQIYDATFREKLLINSWVTMLLEDGHFEEVYIQDNGVDNSGVVLLNVNNSKPDYILYTKGGTVIPDGSHKVELKFAPGFNKLTYKVDNLESYQRYDSYVLTIINVGKMGGSGEPTHDGSINLNYSLMGWTLFTPEIIRRLLDELPHQHYFELGNKKAVQILQKDFEKYFTVYDWRQV
jgi:hypothetical protein